jgi:hypothetical protein
LRQIEVKLHTAIAGGSILLLMQADPIQEWQRLTAHYREMSGGELNELAADFANLTLAAQQALRSEMTSRGLGDPQAANRTPEASETTEAFGSPARNAPEDSDSIFAHAAVALGTRAPEPVSGTPGADDEDDGPHEYTWKTVLCACETSAEARQLCAALKQVGIESWVESAAGYSPYAESEVTNPRVLVAADQLDRARTIAANPIPQEIVDQFKSEVPEYEPPVCPKCGASDPVLEGVDPENTWRCEQCDAQWTESAGSGDEEAPEQS